MSNFIVQALLGQEITVYGDGQQTSSLCYVSDLVDGFVKMMGKTDNLVGAINLGNPLEFTMLELAEKALQKTLSNSKLKFEPLPEDDPKQRQPDINKAIDQLDWQPSVSLDEELDRTIDYFKIVV